jgi:hypothetical protein
MSDQRQLMINYKPIEPETWSVSGIGGMTLPVLGVGDVPVITQIDGEEQDFLITGILVFCTLTRKESTILYWCCYGQRHVGNRLLRQ